MVSLLVVCNHRVFVQSNMSLRWTTGLATTGNTLSFSLSHCFSMSPLSIHSYTHIHMLLVIVSGMAQSAVLRWRLGLFCMASVYSVAILKCLVFMLVLLARWPTHSWRTLAHWRDTHREGPSRKRGKLGLLPVSCLCHLPLGLDATVCASQHGGASLSLGFFQRFM